MIIRTMTPDDFDQLKEIHEEHFKKEFDFHDYIGRKFLDKWVVVDDEDKIIVGGGVRLITESIAITDMRRSVRDRQQALHMFLHACSFTSARQGFEGVHAFVMPENEQWIEILRKYGFNDTKGKSLFLQVLNG